MDEGNERESRDFTANTRKSLFLELARRPEGAGTSEVYQRAIELGDKVTEEAYYNLARRLAHRGLLILTRSEQGTRYQLGAEDQWLEEDQLSQLIDPDYPLLAITIWRESLRQINEVPEEVWRELRERLRGESARELFHQAIVSYCDDFHAQIVDLVEFERTPTPALARLRQEAEDSRSLLLRLTKYGLGLSREAVNVPVSVNAAIREFKEQRVGSYVNEEILTQELARRIEPEAFICGAITNPEEQNLLIGAVDGSTRGGILSFLGEEGDFNVGHAPMIAINTSVGQIDRRLPIGNRTIPVFMRLPEKPEDMQRQDNRYTVMAKLLYPDLSDSKYMHSVGMRWICLNRRPRYVF